MVMMSVVFSIRERKYASVWRVSPVANSSVWVRAPFINPFILRNSCATPDKPGDFGQFGGFFGPPEHIKQCHFVRRERQRGLYLSSAEIASQPCDDFAIVPP